MKDLTFTGSANLTTLDQDLRGALGAALIGVSVSGEQVRIHLADDAPLDQVNAATTLTHQHLSRTASGYYRQLPAFQAQSQAFIAAYRIRMAQRTTTFKQRMKAIQ